MTTGSREATRNPHDAAGHKDYDGCGPCPTRTPASCPPARMSRTPPAMATFSRRASLRSHVSAWGPHAAHWSWGRTRSGCTSFSRPSWSPFSLLDCGERPALGQVPPRPPSVQASRACATASDETSAPSLNRHLIYASGDFLTSSNLRILRCKVAKECLLYGATERTGVLPPKKDFLVFLSCTESANEDCDEYAF